MEWVASILIAAFCDSSNGDLPTSLGGVDLKLGRSFTLDADFRYVFLDSSGTQVADGNFNYWQATLGVNLNF